MGKFFRNLRLRGRRLFSNYKMHNFFASLRKTLPKLLLASMLTLIFIYSTLHPINKLKVKCLLFSNFTIEIAEYSDGNGVDTHRRQEIIIDGNWMKDGSVYYEFDDGKIYQYYEDFRGGWNKMLYASNASKNNDFGIGGELLKRSNYQRVEGELFVWELNGYIDMGSTVLTNIKVQRVGGIISIVGYISDTPVIIRFTKFGMSGIDLPWEEE